MKKVYFAITNSGSGHINSALALKAQIEKLKFPWQIEILDIYQEIGAKKSLDPDKLYNIFMKNNLGSLITIWGPIVSKLIKLRIKFYIKLLTKLWQEKKPDMLVSLMPLINGCLNESLKSYNPNIPFVTIVTDYNQFFPELWFNKNSHAYICGSQRLITQAKKYGIESRNIMQTSGMIVHPNFYEISVSKAEERKKLNLNKKLPLGIVVYGGYGSKSMQTILKKTAHMNIQLIMICGHNTHLQQTLKNIPNKNRNLILGFVNNLDYYMKLADFFIGKPGPGCISEALICKLPCILEANFFTLHQERYNARWVVENKVGIKIKNYKRIDFEIANLLNNYDFYLENINKINNQAIYEVPELLNSFLNRQHVILNEMEF